MKEKFYWSSKEDLDTMKDPDMKVLVKALWDIANRLDELSK